MLHLSRRTIGNQQQQKLRSLKMMLMWNIITYSKYQWQKEQVVQANKQ